MAGPRIAFANSLSAIVSKIGWLLRISARLAPSKASSKLSAGATPNSYNLLRGGDRVETPELGIGISFTKRVEDWLRSRPAKIVGRGAPLECKTEQTDHRLRRKSR